MRTKFRTYLRVVVLLTSLVSTQSVLADGTYTPLGPRPMSIGIAYQQALGRAASMEELAFWLLVPDGDPRISSAEALTSYLRQEDALIRSGSVPLPENGPTFTVMANVGNDVMSKVISYSYYEGLGRLPTQEEYGSWSSPLRRPAELHQAIQGALSAWIKNSLVTRLMMIRRAYKLALGKEPSINDYITQNRTSRTSGIGFAGLAFSLAQSNDRGIPSFTYPVGNQILSAVNGDSPALPPPDTPPQYSRPVPPPINGNQMPPPLFPNAPTEPCFGAVGSLCNGAPNADVIRNGDGTVTAKVSVGSILHDNCCRSNPGGKWCGGPGNDGKPAQEWNHNGKCVREWDKAFWNTQITDNRQWDWKFSPTQSADLREVPARPSRFRDGTYYDGVERVSTAFLSAPRGTYLDVGDHAFCTSKAAEIISPSPLNGWKEYIRCK